MKIFWKMFFKFIYIIVIICFYERIYNFMKCKFNISNGAISLATTALLALFDTLLREMASYAFGSKIAEIDVNFLYNGEKKSLLVEGFDPTNSNQYNISVKISIKIQKIFLFRLLHFLRAKLIVYSSPEDVVNFGKLPSNQNNTFKKLKVIGNNIFCDCFYRPQSNTDTSHKYEFCFNTLITNGDCKDIKLFCNIGFYIPKINRVFSIDINKIFDVSGSEFVFKLK